MITQMVCRTLFLTVQFIVMTAAVLGAGILAMLSTYYFLISF